MLKISIYLNLVSNPIQVDETGKQVFLTLPYHPTPRAILRVLILVFKKGSLAANSAQLIGLKFPFPLPLTGIAGVHSGSWTSNMGPRDMNTDPHALGTNGD